MKTGAFRFPMIGGGGGSNPDPATYCPANGYIPDPYVPYTPPIEIPAVSSQQILLFCDDNGYGAVSVVANVNSGLVKFECLADDGSTVLFSTIFSSGGTYTYTFPTQALGNYYFIRLSPNTAGSYLTIFRVAVTVGFADEDSNVFSIYINAPNITTLSNLVKNNQHCQRVTFLSTADYLTTLASAFQNSAITFVDYPSSLPALTSMQRAYQDITKAPFKADLSGVILDALSDMSYMFYQANVVEIKLPASLAAVTTMSYFVYRTILLTSITMPTETMTALTNLTYAFQYTNLAEIVHPNMPAVTNISYAWANCSNLVRLVFQGSWNNLATLTSWLATSPNVEELIMPEEITSSVTWPTISTLAKLRIYGNPITLHPTIDTGLYSQFAYNYMVTELTRTVVNPTCGIFVNFISKKLTSFYQPGIRISSIRMGQTTPVIPQFTTCEVDWANSPCNLTIFLIYGQMDATELNRIMTALPTVTGKTLDIRQNPGYAMCDKSIATAKGWTVT